MVDLGFQIIRTHFKISHIESDAYIPDIYFDRFVITNNAKPV